MQFVFSGLNYRPAKNKLTVPVFRDEVPPRNKGVRKSRTHVQFQGHISGPDILPLNTSSFCNLDILANLLVFALLAFSLLCNNGQKTFSRKTRFQISDLNMAGVFLY